MSNTKQTSADKTTLDVPCERCGAQIGELCVTIQGTPFKHGQCHPVRDIATTALNKRLHSADKP